MKMKTVTSDNCLHFFRLYIIDAYKISQRRIKTMPKIKISVKNQDLFIDVMGNLLEEIKDNFGYRIGMYFDPEQEPLKNFTSQQIAEIQYMRQQGYEKYSHLQKKVRKFIEAASEKIIDGEKIKIKVSKELLEEFVGVLNHLKNIYQKFSEFVNKEVEMAVNEENEIEARLAAIRSSCKYVKIEVVNPYTTDKPSEFGDIDSDNFSVTRNNRKFATIINEIDKVIKKFTKD